LRSSKCSEVTCYAAIKAMADVIAIKAVNRTLLASKSIVLNKVSFRATGTAGIVEQKIATLTSNTVSSTDARVAGSSALHTNSLVDIVIAC